MILRRRFQKTIASAFFLAASLCNSGFAQSAGKDSEGSISDIPKPHFKITAQLSEGYDDNVYTSNTNKVQSFFTDVYAHIAADLGSPRTVFTIGLGGGATDYYDRPGRSLDYTGDFSLSIVHKVNSRLTLSVQSFTTYQAEPNFDPQILVSQNRNNGQYLYSNNVFTATYQWSRRVQTVTSYSLYGVFYQDDASAQIDDRFEHNFSNQLLYLVNPTTQLTATYRIGYTQYMHNTDRDIFSNYFLVGVNHSFSPKFTVNLNAGAQVDIPRQGTTQTSPYAEMTTTYAYRRASNIQWYLHYGFDHSSLALNEKHTALRTGVRITQALTGKLSLNLGVFYQHDDYSQTLGASNSTNQDTFDISTGLHFIVTPKLSLDATYTHTEVLSDVATSEYSRNRITIGATYTF
jgi:opacity protein-like surface antigen